MKKGSNNKYSPFNKVGEDVIVASTGLKMKIIVI